MVQMRESMLLNCNRARSTGFPVPFLLVYTVNLATNLTSLIVVLFFDSPFTRPSRWRLLLAPFISSAAILVYY